MRLPASLSAALRRTPRQRIGDAAEDRALAYLQERGLSLVARNFRCRAGELDLVMRDGQALVFVEVRQRADARHGGAAASVTPAKQARLLRAAQVFLQRERSLPPCRFDVVAIDGDRLDWIRDAIQA